MTSVWVGAVLSATAYAAPGSPDQFVQTIRPILAANCGVCHNPANSKNPANFLTAQVAKDIESKRGLWQIKEPGRGRQVPT